MDTTNAPRQGRRHSLVAEEGPELRSRGRSPATFRLAPLDTLPLSDWMAGLVVKPRARIFHGHDWVFSGEVLKVFGNPADGDVISLKDGRDRFLGSAIYNAKSQIVARRFSRRKQSLDLDFFQRRIAQAIDYRERRGINPRFCRVVWSESDGLPGLIVDRYGDCLVLQTLTLAMDQRKEIVVRALEDLFGGGGRAAVCSEDRNADGTAPVPPIAGGTPALRTGKMPVLRVIIERNDAPVRRAEGMELRSGVLLGDAPGAVEIEIAGLTLKIDLLHSQKTGFYLDQLPNYPLVAAHANGRRVLDCFSSQGGFALACARAGATEVIGVEGGAESVRAAQQNSARNELSVRWVEEDVFQFLRGAEKADEKFDLIILDPPSFTKNKGGLRDALRGYNELHVRAFKMLSPNGLLATFSCSHHVSGEIFDQMIADALVDARSSARRLRRFEQALDHPVLPTLPETEYFRGRLLEMMPGR